MCVIGFDTSNYTTSIAYFDGMNGENQSKLLPVKDGALGLRQSDAVFGHIKSLPELSGRLFSILMLKVLKLLASAPGQELWKAAICLALLWDILMLRCLLICWMFRCMNFLINKAMWLRVCGVPADWT